MSEIQLPGLDCGACGKRTCDEFAVVLKTDPGQVKRCIHVSGLAVRPASAFASPAATAGAKNAAGAATSAGAASGPIAAACAGCEVTGCASAAGVQTAARRRVVDPTRPETWQDSLGRDIDFYLEHFPEEPGPRETILPHNPMLTREMDIRVGEVLIGRPLGMSCGCPVTHCGIVMEVDPRTGVIVWCVTGPLQPRQQGFKDLGYYTAEAYDGLVTATRSELKIGMRYFFQPRMCMLQWRHSGLVNYLSRVGNTFQVRLEGLFIG